MGLREQAKLDARAILEDTSGFAWPVTLVSPLGVFYFVNGFTTDVGQTIDPDTGQAVAGQRASVAFARGALPVLPEAVAEGSRKPWLATFFDSEGEPATFKVIDVLPDRALGVVVLLLEVFQRAIVHLAPVELALPPRTLDGSLAPAVGALAGALVLPSLQLSGAFTMALAGSLVLPSDRPLSGNVTPLVVLGGSVTLPSLQLSGAVTPAVGALAGALVLPSLQLSGAFTMALAGALALPSLQLSGAFTMALAGSLVLPSLQLSGSLTVSASKMSGWLRLAASSQSGGEWTPSIVDVLNPGSPMVQTDVDRRAAVGVSVNGLPTMVFDGTDVHLWPQIPATASTTKVGFWLWYRRAAVGDNPKLYIVAAGVAGSSFNRLQVQCVGNRLRCEVYVSAANGRSGTTAPVFTAGQWHAIYVQYDSSRGGDANLAIFVGGVNQTLTYLNVGAGAAMTVLQAATGAALIGGGADTDTPDSAIANGDALGPNAFAFNDNLTAAEIAAFLQFEVPT
jgi:hypothetical protein